LDMISRRIEESAAVSPAEFMDGVQGRSRPLVLRGQVGSWPAVRLARSSPRALFESLRSLDDGVPVGTMRGPPGIGGRYFYTPTLDGVNFERGQQLLGEAIDELLGAAGESQPPSLYVGALPLDGRRSAFAADNPLALWAGNVTPRIWLANASTVQTHLDMSENLACVVCGTRRFTLFPPDQIGNLYVGPLDFTLAGQPVSLARMEEPDFERFPRFREALAAASYAELGPGDALYIPYMWWHHVRMTEPLNVLVNYWWARSTPWQGSPFDCLVHAIAAFRALPDPERAAWHSVFNHYIFGDESAVAHIPATRRGILGPLTPALAERIRLWLQQALRPR